MILTPDFVLLYDAKTDGPFVTRVLSRLYADRPGAVVTVDEPAVCSRIPASHQGKPIVSTLRNPFEHYVAQYHAGWWRLHPEEYCGAAAMRAFYPHYPELSFGEFVNLANARFLNCHRGRPTGFVNRHLPPGDELGWHTEEFVRRHFRDPEAAFARLDPAALAGGDPWREMFPVHFLPAERWHQAFHRLLLDLGLPAAADELVRTAEPHPVEAGRAADDRWQRHYTPAVRNAVRHRERLLFALFPRFEWSETAAPADAVAVARA